MLVFEDVGQQYPDGTQALKGVTLAVPRGQFCVVLGSSGAGKSTLLRAVNGLVAPTRGRVLVDGVEVGPRTLPTIRPRVAMIHQQFHLSPRLSVATNVLAGALPVVSTARPQYIAYTLYILDRNVRMAAVIGVVGAGGIGQELEGRYDMFNYGHVSTILLVLFVTVFALDQLSARVRARLI